MIYLKKIIKKFNKYIKNKKRKKMKLKRKRTTSSQHKTMKGASVAAKVLKIRP